MRQDKRNILVTRPLSARQIEYARILGLEPIIKPALEFTFPEYWDSVLKTISGHPRSPWIFTSSNGVKALKKLMQKGLQVQPKKRIFAVGAKTQESLQKIGLDAKIPFTQDGKHLAKMIANEEKINTVLYFHGNLSRDEMTNILLQNNIEVIEQEVYQTNIHPVTMPNKPLSGILFYSPSAVDGFKQGTGFEAELPPLFAIGPTTVGALKEQSDQHIQFASRPDTKVLLQTVSDYIFKPKETHPG